MTVTRQLNGSWHVMDVIADQLIQRTYYGYTKREAQRLFREEVRNDTSTT